MRKRREKTDSVAFLWVNGKCVNQELTTNYNIHWKIFAQMNNKSMKNYYELTVSRNERSKCSRSNEMKRFVFICDAQLAL